MATALGLRSSQRSDLLKLAYPDDPLEIVDRADRLLYQAKGQGRGGTIAGQVA